ncbi:FecCD family ABC transporter permease [Phytoactinopolyspora halotolerans]|uniref:Iron ABC transporter permease n=1 Tax=Phytoactinopolyspora halotolerans TaxID=1981512 RepID=A0A6L9SA62_9ACTN|nr:iron ABC transporter permease [Phytoactinopolyspora halotolerans]NEE01933.1 iron ABC transporter permease [Phytoactinopolyspora halotolerans]
MRATRPRPPEPASMRADLPNERHASDLPWGARRYGTVLLAGGILVGALMVVSLGVGHVAISPADVLAALRGEPAVEYHDHIVLGLRLPRVLIAAVAGCMLGLAGALLQAATRNDLAEPSLLGVSGGAVLAIVAVLTMTGWDTLPGLWSGAIALAGAFAAGGLAYVLSWSRRVGAVRLVLDGVLVSAVLSSLVSVLLLLDGSLFSAVLRWVVGTLNGRVWQDWAVLWPWALVAVPAGLLMSRQAAALWLGDDVAAATGLRVGRARLAVLATATVLTAGAVAAVGAVGFVGLLSSHIARLLVGSHPRRVLPLACVVGAGLLVSADLLAELLTALWPEDGVQNRPSLPAGAVTAMLGGPVLVALLARRRT